MKRARDQKLVERWLEALRGGKYQQTTGHLYLKENDGKDTFCCLGVFCDLAGAEWYAHRRLTDHKGDEFATVMGTARNEFTMPDSDRREEMGLTSSQVEELAVLNDSGRDFRTIADRIVEMLAMNDEVDQTWGQANGR